MHNLSLLSLQFKRLSRWLRFFEYQERKKQMSFSIQSPKCLSTIYITALFEFTCSEERRRRYSMNTMTSYSGGRDSRDDIKVSVTPYICQVLIQCHAVVTMHILGRCSIWDIW